MGAAKSKVADMGGSKDKTTESDPNQTRNTDISNEIMGGVGVRTDGAGRSGTAERGTRSTLLSVIFDE